MLLLFDLLLLLCLGTFLSHFKFSVFSFLLVDNSNTHLLSPPVVNGVILDKSGNAFSAIIDLWKLNKKRNYVKQMTVFRVIIPTQNGEGLLWLQHVCWWGVVQNHGILAVPTDLAHVFGKDTINEGAVFSEQSHGAVPIKIHLIHQWVSVLWKRSCEYD